MSKLLNNVAPAAQTGNTDDTVLDRGLTCLAQE
jgi:hypothetical protein